jgi:hypothetical protein
MKWMERKKQNGGKELCHYPVRVREDNGDVSQASRTAGFDDVG